MSKTANWMPVLGGLALVLAAAPSANAEPAVTTIGSTEQIIAQARADLTPQGAAWANDEAQLVRTGKIQPAQVEKDAAMVNEGVKPGGNADELVLIALVNARNARSNSEPDAGASGRASLDQSIGNIIQTLTDTQRPAPRKNPADPAGE